MKVAVVGCGHGELDNIYAGIKHIEQTDGVKVCLEIKTQLPDYFMLEVHWQLCGDCDQLSLFCSTVDRPAPGFGRLPVSAQ